MLCGQWTVLRSVSPLARWPVAAEGLSGGDFKAKL